MACIILKGRATSAPLDGVMREALMLARRLGCGIEVATVTGGVITAYPNDTEASVRGRYGGSRDSNHAAFRAMRASMLREHGRTFHEIAETLAVSITRAKQLAVRGDLMRRMPLKPLERPPRQRGARPETVEKIKAARRMRAAGASYNEIAAALGCTKTYAIHLINKTKGA